MNINQAFDKMAAIRNEAADKKFAGPAIRRRLAIATQNYLAMADCESYYECPNSQGEDQIWVNCCICGTDILANSYSNLNTQQCDTCNL